MKLLKTDSISMKIALILNIFVMFFIIRIQSNNHILKNLKKFHHFRCDFRFFFFHFIKKKITFFEIIIINQTKERL